MVGGNTYSPACVPHFEKEFVGLWAADLVGGVAFGEDLGGVHGVEPAAPGEIPTADADGAGVVLAERAGRGTGVRAGRSLCWVSGRAPCAAADGGTP